jgi:Tfp pilus assembly protein PilX
MIVSTNSVTGKRQQGIGLIMSLLILTILSLLGLGLMTNATLETRIQSNARSSSLVYYAAESGLEEASYRLIGDSLNTIPLTQLDTVTEVVYIRQNSSINPTDSSSSDYDTEYASSNFGTVTYYTTNQSSNPIPYRWIKLSMKTKRLSGHDVNNGGLTNNQDVPIYYDQAEYLYDPGAGINASKTGYPVYQLTSFARTSDGASYKVRREISSAGFELPGAIFFDGPNPTFADAPSSNDYWVNGNDQAGGGYNMPAIGVISDAADTSISAGLPGPDHYIGSGGSTPDVQNVAPSLPESFTTPQGMEGLVNSIADYANATHPGGTTTCSGAGCWGTAASPKINVFEGDCDLGNGTGYGVLIVRGTFHMQGSGSFYGLILVVGQGTMDFSGGGNGEIQGGIFLAKTRDTSNNILSTLGSPAIDWNGGGGNGVFYNSFHINKMFKNMAFIKLAFKELSQ